MGGKPKRKVKRKVKNKGGRPTKYKPKYAKKLIKFFDVEPFEDMELPHYFNDEEHRVKWADYKRLAVKLPTLRDFAKSISVGISTVYDWLNENHASFQKRFSDAFTHAKEIRKDFLIQNALQGLYPPLTFKFVAVNLTDMTDTQEHTHDISKETAELLGLIDGSTKGKLPNKTEGKNAG